MIQKIFRIVIFSFSIIQLNLIAGKCFSSLNKAHTTVARHKPAQSPVQTYRNRHVSFDDAQPAQRVAANVAVAKERRKKKARTVRVASIHKKNQHDECLVIDLDAQTYIIVKQNDGTVLALLREINTKKRAKKAK